MLPRNYGHTQKSSLEARQWLKLMEEIMGTPIQTADSVLGEQSVLGRLVDGWIKEGRYVFLYHG